MKSKPKVSVIVTHHLNDNDKYLEACLLGLRYSKGIAFETVVMSSAQKKPSIDRLISHSTATLCWEPELDTATKKIHHAVEDLISEDATHLMFLSDDVIVSQDCIADMYQAFRNRHLIMSPMSNSDLYGRYEADLEIGQGISRKMLVPDMSIEEFTYEQIMELIHRKRKPKILIRTEWVCFYAVMMTKQIWETNHGYDPLLEYRHNDQDFCMRASKLGVPSIINFGAFAFHFGSRTMKHVDEVLRQNCSHHFVNKWKYQ